MLGSFCLISLCLRAKAAFHGHLCFQTIVSPITGFILNKNEFQAFNLKPDLPYCSQNHHAWLL
jgi:hypothetical protein